MTVAILIHGVQMPWGPDHCPESGHYIQRYDVGASDGRDSVLTTLDINQAAHFADAAEALEFWRTQSRTVPFRDDGEPNRPLTAFTVEMVPV
jgi:hypothetical protein